MYGWDDDDDDKSATDGYQAANDRLRKDAGIFERKKRGEEASNSAAGMVQQ